MNWRRTSEGLTKDQISELHAAAHRATRIRRPLTVFATFNPALARGLTPTETTDVFDAIKNKLGVTARRLGFDPAFVWVIEVSPLSEAEPHVLCTHMHALVHVPFRQIDKFEKIAQRWLPYNNEVKIKPITDLPGLLFYLSKQREGGSNVGPYAGKRFGMSELLRPKPMVYAIKRHSESVAAQFQPL